ncbi:MAG: biotin--[acetyl-CoA-carboxylase] ligase [Bacteroidota bacterium]
MNFTDKNIIVLTEIDSTNNYAKQLIKTGQEEGTVVLAQYQKKGRGQQGNYWESEPGKNFLMSLILYPDFLNAGDQFYLSKIVSLALVELLENEVEGVSIKWPNDIYVGEKKIAGILIENSVTGNQLSSSVAGIGLNLNQKNFKSDAPNPVSLRQLTGENYDVQIVMHRFLELFNEWYKILKSGSVREINVAYFSNLFRKTWWSWYKKDDDKFEARIVGVGEFGQLQLEDKSGKISEFMFKEVEFVL